MMKRLVMMLLLTLIFSTGFAANDAHDGHNHGPAHSNEGEVHDLGHVSIGGVDFEVELHGEITPGAEAVISIEVDEGKPPQELRVWIGEKNGRGSVKSLLQADSHGHFHGHLEVPAKLTHGSAVWLDVQTRDGRKRASVAVPGEGHDHHKH